MRCLAACTSSTRARRRRPSVRRWHGGCRSAPRRATSSSTMCRSGARSGASSASSRAMRRRTASPSASATCTSTRSPCCATKCRDCAATVSRSCAHPKWLDSRVLLALFLIDLAAGLLAFLPLVGRRNAGVKFYRMMLIIGGALAAFACAAHAAAHARELAIADAVCVVLTVVVWFVLRYPKRLIFQSPYSLMIAAYVVTGVVAWRAATQSPLAWAIAGSLSSIAILGSVNLAMILGH